MIGQTAQRHQSRDPKMGGSSSRGGAYLTHSEDVLRDRFEYATCVIWIGKKYYTFESLSILAVENF